jgi:hypothetical protein
LGFWLEVGKMSNPDAVALVAKALALELGHVSDLDTQFAHKLITALTALKILDGATADAEQPLREMDLAFFELFDLFIDILVRMGVPKDEFDQQFANTISKVKDFPQAKYITEKMANRCGARNGAERFRDNSIATRPIARFSLATVPFG